jgi:genome maintenance exonuclease 1
MITAKFDYPSLHRHSVNGQRFYETPTGAAVPSVTSVLDRTKPEQAKQALQEWRKRVGEKQAQAITTEAAGRGTRMHKWIENHVQTGEIGTPGSNPYSQVSHAMAQVIIDQGLSRCQEFWGTEVPLYFPQVYAGTTDLVGVHDNTDAIMDHKQTNKPKKREWINDYFLQLVAYALAHNEVYGTAIRKGVIFMCVAPQEAKPGIWTQPQFQEFVLEGQEFDRFTDAWLRRLEEYYMKL